MQDLIRLQEKHEANQEANAVATKQLVAQLSQLDTDLEATENSHRGVAELVTKHQSFLDELETLLKSVHPEFIDNRDRLFQEKGKTVENYLHYYRGLIQTLKNQQTFRYALNLRLELEEKKNQSVDTVLQRIGKNRGLSDSYYEALLLRWRNQPISNLFQRLKHISLIVTKADRFQLSIRRVTTANLSYPPAIFTSPRSVIT